MFVFPSCCLMFLITGEGHRKCWICSDQKSWQSQLVPQCQTYRWDTPCSQWPGASTREPVWVGCGWGGPWAALLHEPTDTRTDQQENTVCSTDHWQHTQSLLLSIKPQSLVFHLPSKPCSNLLPHASLLASSSPASTTKQLDKAAGGRKLHHFTWNFGRLRKAGLEPEIAQLRTTQISLCLP